eukprot:3004583-Rhodomonas_salina.1
MCFTFGGALRSSTARTRPSSPQTLLSQLSHSQPESSPATACYPRVGFSAWVTLIMALHTQWLTLIMIMALHTLWLALAVPGVWFQVQVQVRARARTATGTRALGPADPRALAPGARRPLPSHRGRGLERNLKRRSGGGEVRAVGCRHRLPLRKRLWLLSSHARPNGRQGRNRGSNCGGF